MTTLNRDLACNLISSVLDDAEAWDCSLDFHADRVFLDRMIVSRGFPFICVTLPKLGKVLDEGISQGYLSHVNLPKEIAWVGGKGPKLFYGLFSKIFDCEVKINDRFRTGNSWDPIPVLYRPDPNAIFFLRTLCYLFKKLDVTCPPLAVEQAVSRYFVVDRALRVPHMHWDTEASFFEASLQMRKHLSFTDDMGEYAPRAQKHVLSILDSVCRMVWSNVPVLAHHQIVPKHGPGAVCDLSSLADKYTLPNWPSKLEEFFPQDMFAFSSEEIAKDYGVEKSRVEPLGKLFAVPKDFTKPRLITVEPTSHQFLQQGLLEWIRENFPFQLRRSIDFLDQRPSQEAARKASISLEDATVDLSEASDRLSLWTVERAIQHESLLLGLYSTRTRGVYDGTGSSTDRTLLRKFAGQGSAVTFPIQSAIYCCCCIAAVLAEDGLSPTFRNISLCANKVRVFGDDIVIPKRALLYLDLIFNHLELKINVGKTHYQGLFREACGGDYFKGYDVTPLYVTTLGSGTKQAPSESVALVDISNNAYEKGLWHTAKAVSDLLPEHLLRGIPVSNRPQGVLTLRTHLEGVRGVLRDELDRQGKPYCQATEVRGYVPYASISTEEREGYNDLHDFFLSKRKSRQKPIWETPFAWSNGYSLSSTSKLKLRRRWVLVR